jgi:hypothetical protein
MAAGVKPDTAIFTAHEEKCETKEMNNDSGDFATGWTCCVLRANLAEKPPD